MTGDRSFGQNSLQNTYISIEITVGKCSEEYLLKFLQLFHVDEVFFYMQWKLWKQEEERSKSLLHKFYCQLRGIKKMILLIETNKNIQIFNIAAIANGQVLFNANSVWNLHNNPLLSTILNQTLFQILRIHE